MEKEIRGYLIPFQLSAFEKSGGIRKLFRGTRELKG